MNKRRLKKMRNEISKRIEFVSKFVTPSRQNGKTTLFRQSVEVCCNESYRNFKLFKRRLETNNVEMKRYYKKLRKEQLEKIYTKPMGIYERTLNNITERVMRDVRKSSEQIARSMGII